MVFDPYFFAIIFLLIYLRIIFIKKYLIINCKHKNDNIQVTCIVLYTIGTFVKLLILLK